MTMNAIALNLPIAFPLPLHVIGSTQCHYAQLSSGRRGKLIPIRDYKVPLFMEAGFAVIAFLRTYVRLSRPGRRSWCRMIRNLFDQLIGAAGEGRRTFHRFRS
jgi:hypothetical protein